jgi:hypothetical protein
MLQSALPTETRDLFNPLEYLLRREGGLLLGNRWAIWILVGGTLLTVILALAGAIWLTPRRGKRERRDTWILFASNCVCWLQIFIMALLTWGLPQSLLWFFGVNSASEIRPLGVTAVINMIHFGQKMLWGDLVLCLLLMLTIYLLDRLET